MRRVLKAILIAGDAGIFWGTFLLAYWLRYRLPFLPQMPVQPFEPYFRLSFVVAFIGFVLMNAAGLYRLRRTSFGLDELFKIFKVATMTGLTVVVLSFVLRGYSFRYELETYSRLIIAISWALNMGALPLWRYVFFRFLARPVVRRLGSDRVLIVGTGPAAERFYRAVREKGSGYQPIGFICNGPVPEVAVPQGRIVGTLEDLPRILALERVDEVVVVESYLSEDHLMKVIRDCERADVKLSILPDITSIVASRTETYEIAGVPVFSVQERMLTRWNKFVKRAMDISISIFLILLLFPILVFVALAIKLESRGPILFKQERMGKGEKRFFIYKFRSMYQDAEERKPSLMHLNEADGPIFKMRNDPRVTKIGRIIRRLSIDEFPQVINVLKGEMSLVGPRPYPTAESEQFRGYQKRRFDVLPGMTGLAQVSGRSDLTMDETIRLDIYYIENWSPLLDLKILLKTIPAVLSGKGAY